MTIISTGALALSAIQTEFGGTNPISLSEYYAGGARVTAGTSGINGAIPSTGAIAMSKFYGASNGDTQNVTVGIYTSAGFGIYSGYYPGQGIGSISDGTSNIYGGAAIKALYHWSQPSPGGIFLVIAGTLSNSGWTTLTINGLALSRAAATFSAGTDTQWRWPTYAGASNDPTKNPFGTTSGAVVQAIFS